MLIASQTFRRNPGIAAKLYLEVPTGHFTILDQPNLSVYVSELRKIRLSTDFVTLQL